MLQQRSEEWYEARLGKATGSKFSDIMTKGRGSYELAARKNYRSELVLERLTGKKAETWTSPAMQWGIDNEPFARQNYMYATGQEVVEEFFVQHPTLQAGCSPDGYVGDEGLVEIKCPNSATHIATLRTGQLPSQYEAQVQGQLWLTGRSWCDFVSFDPRMPDNAQMIVIHIERDQEYIDDLEYEITKFLSEVDQEELFVQMYTGMEEN